MAGPSFEQSFPPCLGEGLLHSRLRSVVPPPQDLVQGANSDQRPYPPSTITIKKGIKRDFIEAE